MFESIFGGNDGEDEVEQLRRLLNEREATLQLEAVYGRPYPNTTEEPTVVFPYTLYTSNGEAYGSGSKEFLIPDNGLLDTESDLVWFIARQHQIVEDDVDFEYLMEVEGSSADAELDDGGDVYVGVGGGE